MGGPSRGTPVAYRSRKPPGCPCQPPSAGRRRPPLSGRRRCRSPRWGRGGGRRRPRGSRSSSGRSAPKHPAAGPRLRERRGERPGERRGRAAQPGLLTPLPRPARGPATCAVVRALQVPLHTGRSVGRDVPLGAGCIRGLPARWGRRGLLGRRLLHGGGGGSGAGGAPTCSRAARAAAASRENTRPAPPLPAGLARAYAPPSCCGGGRRSPGRSGSCRCLWCPARHALPPAPPRW